MILDASHVWVRKEHLKYFFDSIKIGLDKMDIVNDNIRTSLMVEPSGPRTWTMCPGFSFAHAEALSIS